MAVPTLAAKRLTFNGVDREIFGSILRIATSDDKQANKITSDEVYLVVDFDYGGVNYRGLWKQDECLIVG
jgi:hypothetical protein